MTCLNEPGRGVQAEKGGKMDLLQYGSVWPERSVVEYERASPCNYAHIYAASDFASPS